MGARKYQIYLELLREINLVFPSTHVLFCLLYKQYLYTTITQTNKIQTNLLQNSCRNEKIVYECNLYVKQCQKRYNFQTKFITI